MIRYFESSKSVTFLDNDTLLFLCVFSYVAYDQS